MSSTENRNPKFILNRTEDELMQIITALSTLQINVTVQGGGTTTPPTATNQSPLDNLAGFVIKELKEITAVFHW